jgi:hypothetical protein
MSLELKDCHGKQIKITIPKSSYNEKFTIEGYVLSEGKLGGQKGHYLGFRRKDNSCSKELGSRYYSDKHLEELTYCYVFPNEKSIIQPSTRELNYLYSDLTLACSEFLSKIFEYSSWDNEDSHKGQVYNPYTETWSWL